MSNKPKETRRNQDGTFKKGYSGNPNNINNGRPKNEWSFRELSKIYAVQTDKKSKKKKIDLAIEKMWEIALDNNHPKQLEALDKIVKLSGNYDPAESKISGEIETNQPYRPLDGLNINELKKLLKNGKK